MLGKPRILSLFPNSFNKFNKTSTHVRSSIYLISFTRSFYLALDIPGKVLTISLIISILEHDYAYQNSVFMGVVN